MIVLHSHGDLPFPEAFYAIWALRLGWMPSSATGLPVALAFFSSCSFWMRLARLTSSWAFRALIFSLRLSLLPPPPALWSHVSHMLTR